MLLAHTCTGPLSSCSLLAVAFAGFCVVSTEAFLEVKSPKIVAGNFSWTGDGAVISCKADPGHPDEFTLIYWLVNRTFIQMAYPRRRIYEAEEKAMEADGLSLIRRDLVFTKVRREDRRANFTCVVNSPAGMDKATFRVPETHAVKPRSERKPAIRRRRRLMGKKPRSRKQRLITRSQLKF